MPYLTEDIKSSCKPSHYYGHKGDEVSIISTHEIQSLVRHIGVNDGFPVLNKFLSDIKPIIHSSEEQIIIQTVEVKKTRKASTAQIPSLF